MSENYPKHIIAVSAYITNREGKTLLVMTHWRKDTWEPQEGKQNWDKRKRTEEIFDAEFVALTEENIGEYITRTHRHSRTLDAMRAEDCIPYETW